MSDLNIKAYEKLCKDFIKLREKAKEKREKELNKAQKTFITFKGEQCHTHKDIQDMLEADLCSCSEADKAHDRLDALLKTDLSGESVTDIYISALNNFISNLKDNIEEEKFNQLSPDEQLAVLEGRV